MENGSWFKSADPGFESGFNLGVPDSNPDSSESNPDSSDSLVFPRKTAPDSNQRILDLNLDSIWESQIRIQIHQIRIQTHQIRWFFQGKRLLIQISGSWI